jgi:hypothetical protein
MLELIESRSSGGALDIVYTRREDAFRSYMADCKDAEITLCVDEGNRVRAQMVCLPRRVYIGGKVRTVGYVTGLCKRTDSFVNLKRLLHAALDDAQADFFFYSILSENGAGSKMLDKKRGYMPDLRSVGNYTTYLFSPYAPKKPRHGFTFRRADAADAEKLLRHYRDYGRNHDFFPEMTSLSAFHGLHAECFYLLTHPGGDIAAAGALWDQRDFKQHIVKAYNGIYKTLSKWNVLLRPLRYPPLPQQGEVADFAYLSFFAAGRDDPDIIRIFLGEAAAAARPLYGAICVGAIENSETRRILDTIKNVHFGSRLCCFDLKRNDAGAELGSRPAYFECGLL